MKELSGARGKRVEEGTRSKKTEYEGGKGQYRSVKITRRM